MHTWGKQSPRNLVQTSNPQGSVRPSRQKTGGERWNQSSLLFSSQKTLQLAGSMPDCLWTSQKWGTIWLCICFFLRLWRTLTDWANFKQQSEELVPHKLPQPCGCSWKRLRAWNRCECVPGARYTVISGRLPWKKQTCGRVDRHSSYEGRPRGLLQNVWSGDRFILYRFPHRGETCLGKLSITALRPKRRRNRAT